MSFPGIPIDPNAVQQVESGGNPFAISPKGAVGPMQTMPTTLTNPGFGVRPAQNNSPQEQQRVGDDYLAAMQNRYANPVHALVAYDWGPGNADKWIANGANPSDLPAETKNYVQRVAAASSAHANYFSKFDDARTQSSSAPASTTPASSNTSQNYFAKYDDSGQPPASPAQKNGWTFGSLAKNVGAGLEKGIIGATAGLVDMLPIVSLPRDLANGFYANMPLGAGVQRPSIPTISDLATKALDWTGYGPSQVRPSNAGERIAQNVGMGLSAGLLPIGDAGLLANVANAGIGAVSGFGSGVAQEAVTDRYKPLASVVGGLGAGLLPVGIETAARTTLPALKDSYNSMASAYSDAAAGQQATNQFRGAAGSPASLGTLYGPEHTLVPGSEPTSFQQTGDLGIGSLERQFETKNPAPFQQRRAEQNQARSDVLRNVETNGDPASVASSFQNHLNDLDNFHAQQVATATQNAQQAANLGGGESPEIYGQQLRDSLQSARDNANAATNRAWSLVDPDKTLTVQSAPLVGTAKSLLSEITPSSEPMTPSEQAIISTVSNYRPNVPFSELNDLRSWVNGALADARRNSNFTSVRRLSMLRGAIEDSVGNTVANQVAENPDLAKTLQDERDDWLSRRNTSASTGTYGPTRQTSVPATSGAETSSSGQSGSIAGDTGLQQQPFTAQNQQLLNEAKASTKNLHQTYDEGAVGRVLQSSGFKGNYRLSEGSVPSAIFSPGPNGAANVRQFRQAVGDQAAQDVLRDHVATQIQREAINQDGTIDPSRLQKFSQKYDSALSEFPQLKEQAKNAATATELLSDAAAARKSVISGYQKGIAGKFLGLSDPEDVTRTIGGFFNSRSGVKQMDSLMRSVQSNPEAVQGVRKAVADYMTRKFISNSESGTSGENVIAANAFQNFLKNNQAVLGKAFSKNEMDSMNAVAADIARAKRSKNALRLPGRSNTAQDVEALKRGQPSGMMQRARQIGMDSVAGMLGYLAHGPEGAAAGFAGSETLGRVVSSLKASGIQRSDQIVEQMLLDPKFAGEMLRRYPVQMPQNVPARIRAVLAASALSAGQSQQSTP
ncbi:MAG: lytic transglycosylase domain-containing protein [Patescibacteria group bacterium]|nr:lytic transglycosylase domain-containing protein [Patescibacteria group bacterium]